MATRKSIILVISCLSSYILFFEGVSKMSVSNSLRNLLILCFFLTGCGPKIIFQDKCKEEYGKLTCSALESEYKKYREKANTEKKLREQKAIGDPYSSMNASSMHVDRFGTMFYKFESPAEEEYKWRLQTLRDILLERKCKTSLPLNDDIEVKIHHDSVYRRN